MYKNNKYVTSRKTLVLNKKKISQMYVGNKHRFWAVVLNLIQQINKQVNCKICIKK